MSLATPRKGYKSVPWLFGKEIEIPEEWEYGRIEHFCNKITSGGTPNRDNSEYYGGQIPWIKSGELKNNFLSESEEKISEKGLSESSAKLFPKNTLLIAMYGVTIGKTAILEKEATTNQAICAILPNTNFDSFYLQQLLISMKNILISFGMGAGQPNINQEIIKTLHIPLPPLQEQQRIATVLSNVDNLIESTGKVITHSKKVKTGLMQKLLTRGIGHTKFKKVPWLFGKEIEIPQEWEVCKIRNLVENKTILEIQDGNHGELHPKSIDFVNQGIPFVTADCIINNNVDYKKCNLLPSGFLKTLRIGFSKKGDVILTHKGSIGFTAIVNDEFETIILSPQTTYYRSSDKLIPKFLYYIFQTHNFQKQLQAFGKQSTRDYVGITAQQHLIIPFIQDVIEQQKIATILSNIDSKITSQEQYKEKLERLKKSLMQKLLTGEIRVKL